MGKRNFLFTKLAKKVTKLMKNETLDSYTKSVQFTLYVQVNSLKQYLSSSLYL